MQAFVRNIRVIILCVFICGRIAEEQAIQTKKKAVAGISGNRL